MKYLVYSAVIYIIYTGCHSQYVFCCVGNSFHVWVPSKTPFVANCVPMTDCGYYKHGAKTYKMW